MVKILRFLLLSLLFCAYCTTVFSQVNGYNATFVDYSTGSFNQINRGYWQETTSSNQKINFAETQRDEWSVYLYDRSRDISIQLDLHRKEIYIYWERPNRAKLYNIVRFSAGQPSTPSAATLQGYIKCASENGTYFFSSPVDVAYGANGKYYFRNGVTGQIQFNNATFGDPIPGIVKSGYYKQPTITTNNQENRISGPSGYTKCAAENGTYYFNSPVDVAYGANGRYYFRNGVTGQINFNNTTFGDPIPGIAKSGYYRQSSVVINNPPINPPNTPSSIPATTTNTVNPIAPSDMNLVLKWIASEVADAQVEYCYKQTNLDRGVGKIANSCPSGLEKDGALCYPQCRTNYDGVGPLCWQNCPPGYTNLGLTCTRGADSKSAPSRLAKCPDGFRNMGLTCYRAWPPKSLSMNSMVCPSGYFRGADARCHKNCPEGYTNTGETCYKGPHTIAHTSYGRGAGTVLTCPPGMIRDETGGPLGLCYTKCPAGFHGVGPVCWQDCPPNQPVDCAAGCAKNTAACVQKTVDQVTAVGELASNVISLGATAEFRAARASLKTAIRAGDRIAAQRALKLSVRELVNGFERLTTRKVTRKLKEEFRNGADKWVIEEYAKVQMKIELQEEFSVDDLRDLAGLDPTGMAEVVNSFWHPICAKQNPFPNLSRSYQY